MKAIQTVLVLLSVLALSPHAADAGCQKAAKLALHVEPGSSLNLLDVCVNHGIEIADCCSEGTGCGFTVQAEATGTYIVYVLVVAVDADLGMNQVGFGIDYDGAAESGVDIDGWISCATASETLGSWPDPGSAITLGWGSCQADESDSQLNQAWMVIGGFRVNAYGDDTLALTDRGEGLDAFIKDCEGDDSGIFAFGSIGFGEGFGWDGCNADFYSAGNTCCHPVDGCTWMPYVCCLQSGGVPMPFQPCGSCAVPVDPTTWSRIKQRY